MGERGEPRQLQSSDNDLADVDSDADADAASDADTPSDPYADNFANDVSLRLPRCDTREHRKFRVLRVRREPAERDGALHARTPCFVGDHLILDTAGRWWHGRIPMYERGDLYLRPHLPYWIVWLLRLGECDSAIAQSSTRDHVPCASPRRPAG